MAARLRAYARLMVCSAAAAGCVHYTPRPLAPGPAANALEARRLSDAGLARFALRADSSAPWPPAAWGLHTLTLAALYFNPDLAVARADWSVARAAILTAGGRPNPSVGANVAALTHGATRSPSLLSAVFNIPFVTAGKLSIQQTEARSRSEASRLGVATAAWAVRARVRTAALSVWDSDRLLALARGAEQADSGIAALLQRRLAAGEVSSFDLTSAQIALAAARGARSEAESRHAAARTDLAAALGVPIEALDSIPLALRAFSDSLPDAPAPADARAAAVLSRADIRASLAEYAAAQAALQLEVARQYPDLQIGSALHWEAELNGLTIAPLIVAPLLNQNRGPIAEADARRTAAAARFTQLQAGVLARVDRALAEYGAARQAVADADGAVERQAAASRSVEAAFRAGAADRVALLSARVRAVTTEQSQLTARMRALTALGDLESAIQRPLVGGTRPFPIPERDPSTEARIP